MAFLRIPHAVFVEPLAAAFEGSEQSRQFAKRIFALRQRMPTKEQAAVYVSVRHYLQAVAAVGSDDGEKVNAQMRKMPVDYFGRPASIRPDGRVLYDLTFYQVKAPAESKYPWDYYKPLRTIPKEEAFRPAGEGGCALPSGG